MKKISIVIAICLAVFIIAIVDWNRPNGKWINCRDVDFLPDVPPQVRLECRKIIKDRLYQQRNQDRDKSKVTT